MATPTSYSHQVSQCPHPLFPVYSPICAYWCWELLDEPQPPCIQCLARWHLFVLGIFPSALWQWWTSPSCENHDTRSDSKQLYHLPTILDWRYAMGESHFQWTSRSAVKTCLCRKLGYSSRAPGHGHQWLFQRDMFCLLSKPLRYSKVGKKDNT